MKTKQLLVWASLAFVGAIMTSSPAQADAKSDAKRDKDIEEKFKAADKDNDGKLTLVEAKAGMPRIARGFDKIDKDKKGYLTVEQIKAFAATQ